MKIFDYFRKKRTDEIVRSINKKNIGKRYFLLVMGCFTLALSFNLFFLRYGIVCFGISGISIILSEFGVDPSLFIFAANVILMLVAYIVLGKESALNQLVGAILFPVFIELTSLFTDYIDFGNTEMVVIAILGGVMAGFGSGLIYKSNFSTGGTDVIIEIICKYLHVSMGNASLVVNAFIISLGKIVFSWSETLYAVFVCYLIAVFTDKVLLGISKSKAFYIVIRKEKEKEIRDFLVSLPNVGITVIDAEGGYSKDDRTLLLAVIPTRQYLIVKEGLREIDKDVFFLVCDSYEVSNDKGDFLCY